MLLVGCFGGVSGLSRLDAGGVLEAYPPRRIGETSQTVVVLPRSGSIEKIVVVPRGTLGEFRVEVRQADGTWLLVRSVDGRHVSPVTVRAHHEGDAVRVVERLLARPKQSSAYVSDAGGHVQTILVYGYPLPPREEP
jgi:hypothetical protein